MCPQPDIAAPPPECGHTARLSALRRGWLLALLTIVWNVAECVIAVWAGLLADSVALIGFGFDSLIETSSAVVAAWRVRAELTARGDHFTEHAERMTSRIAGTLLLLLALGITIESGRRLVTGEHETRASPIGIALTGLSLVVMPILGRAKLRVSVTVGSRALRADAFETIACAWMSLTTLVGQAATAAWGWSWADPVAAMALVPLIAREGLEAIRGECQCAEQP